MLRHIKTLINNKRGNIGFVYLIFIFVLMCINMGFGIMETSLSIVTVNEIKDILENVSPSAAREGVDINAHKNEMIKVRYDVPKAKEYFINEVADSISKMAFRGRVRTDQHEIRTYLDEYTSIKPSSGQWANTWGNSGENRKEVDYVIVSTVLPLELINNSSSVDAEKIEDHFNISSSDGVKSPIKVEVSVDERGLGTFIKFEMKIVLK